jgi:hypothetical protein
MSPFENNDVDIFLDEESQSSKELECKKKDLLDREEATWKLKSRSLWIKEGDKNTIFSQVCNYEKHINTIWEIMHPNGYKGNHASKWL